MREVSLVGLVAVVFGLGSFYATGELGSFSIVNLGAGSLLLLAAAIARASRLRVAGGPHARRVIARGLLGIAGATALGVAIERAAAWSEIRFDWTFEQRFELSEATRRALLDLSGGLRATLYHDPLDPRVRRTRLLLQTLAMVGDLEIRERVLDEAPEDTDRFGVASSNTVVFERHERFETVSRPTEGAIYEALYRLRKLGSGTLVVLRGEGEGDPDRSDDLGFSGLAAALATEGYRVRSVVSAAMDEVPDHTDAVIAIAPRRRLTPTAVSALRRYLARGGSLIALLEPGEESGLEGLLAEFGIGAADAVVIDPASGPVEASRAAGIDIVAHNYETHPATQGLDRNRMTYFPGARAFVLRKARTQDELKRVVLSSPRSWTSEDLSLLERSARRPTPDGARLDYQTLVAAGRFPREHGEVRIVAFGDADFASNRYLRTLYNLDLVLNAVHWATQREAEITLRPKIRKTIHFPLPLTDSVQALYSVGLLVPELLLIAGGIVWLRRRTA